MLMSKNVNNDVSKDSPIGNKFVVSDLLKLKMVLDLGIS